MPRTEKLFERVLLLPMHVWLSEAELDMIATRIAEFYGAPTDGGSPSGAWTEARTGVRTEARTEERGSN